MNKKEAQKKSPENKKTSATTSKTSKVVPLSIKNKIAEQLYSSDLSQDEVDKKYIVTNYKTNVSFFTHLYGAKDFWWRLALVVCAAIIGGLVSLFLIQNTGVYTYGLSGVVQGISRLVRVEMLRSISDKQFVETIYSVMFYGLYILLNLPLLVFSWKKIGKKFTILTTVSILVSNIFPFVLSFIPGIENVFLFGDVTPVSAEIDNLYKNYGVFLLTFNQHDNTKFISLFIYTLIAAVIGGITYSLTLTCNASTGGTDIISLDYSMKNNKSLSSLIAYFNIITVLISIFLGSFLSGGLADNNFGYERFFSQNLISALIFSLVSSLVVGRLFPKSKLIQVRIYTDKALEVRDYLYSKNFTHSLTINNTIGGYSLQNKQNIEIVCFHIELPKLLHDVKTADENSLVIVMPVEGLFGSLKVKKTID